MTRWGAPLLLIALGSGMSAFVATHAPKMPSTEALAALPGVALLVVLVVRAAVGPGGRTGDLVVTLLVAFLIGVHVLLLAGQAGVTDGADQGVPLATALLFVALGPVVATLEPGSAMGLRTRATLADPDVWRRAHQRLGIAFAASGVAGVAAMLLTETVIAVAVMGGGPVVAMVVFAAAASREHRARAPRPNDAPPDERD